VGLAPGAGGRQKCWPLDRFIAVGEHLTQLGRVPVFLLGPNESDWAAPIRAALPQALLPLQAADKVTPLLTIALGRRMQAAIANDSGAGHMLAAADVPLISLFGPTPAAKFAPAAQVARVIRAQDHGGESMDLIPVRSVLDELVGVLPL
jgi:ADP-heptose:LPS heptosyltransferase